MNHHHGLAVLVYVYVIQCTVADDTSDTYDTELPIMALDSFHPKCPRCVSDDSAVNITGHFSIGDEDLDMSMVTIKIDIIAGPESPYKTRGQGVWNLYCAIARTTCSKWFIDSYAQTNFTFDCNCAPKVGDSYTIWIPIRPLKNFKDTVLRIRYSPQLDPAKDNIDTVVSNNFSVDSIFESGAYTSAQSLDNNGHKIFTESNKQVLLTWVCSVLYLNIFLTC